MKQAKREERDHFGGLQEGIVLNGRNLQPTREASPPQECQVGGDGADRLIRERDSHGEGQHEDSSSPAQGRVPSRSF